jgi:hypothetical protein
MSRRGGRTGQWQVAATEKGEGSTMASSGIIKGRRVYNGK